MWLTLVCFVYWLGKFTRLFLLILIYYVLKVYIFEHCLYIISEG
jgi:hypothetical protein